MLPVAALAAPVMAAFKPINYTSGSCSCVGKFDPSKISEKKAEDSVSLAAYSPFDSEAHGFSAPMIFCNGKDSFSYGGTLMSGAELRRKVSADRPALGEGYDQALNYLKGLNPLPPFENLRKKHILETEITSYINQSIADYVLAWDPKVLNKPFKGATPPDQCAAYVTAAHLPGESRAINEWAHISYIECKKSKSPAEQKACMDYVSSAEVRLAQDHCLMYDAAIFSWAKCVNGALRTRYNVVDVDDGSDLLDHAFGPPECQCGDAD